MLDNGSTDFNANVRYSCDPGYEMDERVQNMLRCTENKSWGPSPIPFCAAKDCGEIPCPQNSKLNINLFRHTLCIL